MRSAAWLLVLLWPALAAATAVAQQPGCGEATVRIERPVGDAVRIELVDPCRAGRFVSFRHNGEEVTRLADGEGRVRLLRFLGPEPDRIELARPDGSWRVLLDEAEASAPAVGEAQAAPVAEPPAAGGREPSPTPPERAAGEAATAAEGVGAGAAAGAEETRTLAAREEEPAPPPATAPEAAQTPVPWAMHVDESCRVRVDQEPLEPGLVRFRVADGCAAGKVVRVDHRERGWRFYLEIGEEPVELLLPFVDAVSTLDFVVENGGVTTVRVESPDLDAVVRVVLLWEAPVDLDLAVVEPGGRIGSGRGVVGDPAGGTGRGVIERRDGGSSAGHALESYRVPRAAFAGTGAALAVYVADASGGRLAAPPYCGEGARIRVDYRILARVGGEVHERRFRLPAPACGAAPGGDGIYRRALTVAVPPAPVLFPQ